MKSNKEVAQIVKPIAQSLEKKINNLILKYNKIHPAYRFRIKKWNKEEIGELNQQIKIVTYIDLGYKAV